MRARTLAETIPGRESQPRVVGRLAPSPTGELHLGHAFAFCLAWWSARSQQGNVVLRFDDLDVDRAHSQFIDGAVRDLTWLGLDWDGPIVLESSRREELVAQAESLEARGLAYACVCTRGELARMQHGAPQAGQDEILYKGQCRGRYRDRADAKKKTGLDAQLRFLVDDGEVIFEDKLFGVQRVNVAEAVGDFPILRKNSAPAYQLAVVCDDALDQVTEVVRGRDLLPSTARQRLLQHSLGFSYPSTLHVPLVVDQEGRRLAKRDQARSLSNLREHGTDPRQIVAWVSKLSGQELSGSLASAHELLASFDPRRLATKDISGPTEFEGA